jgi:hypothetical protein
MTVQANTFAITRATLGSRTGHALELSLWGNTYVHDPTAETIADITATEASGGTYARTALTGLSYDIASESLLGDDVTVIGVAGTIGAYVISDPDDGDKLIADGTFPSLAVSGDLPITPTDGAWAQYTDSAADIDALAAVLDTTGAATGQVLTVGAPGDPAGWQGPASAPTEGVLVPVVSTVADLATAPVRAWYYIAWETGLTINLPSPTSDRAVVLNVSVIDVGGGLGVPTYTVAGGGAASGGDPDVTGSGFDVILRPGPPEFFGGADWTYRSLPAA